MERPQLPKRYFVIKCNTYQSLVRSFREKIWAVPQGTKTSNEEILNKAYALGEVMLIASVNGSKSFQGYAKMTSSISADAKAPVTFAGGSQEARIAFPFAVEWQKCFVNTHTAGLSFNETAEITNSLDENRCVNISRNLQELDQSAGERLCRLIDNAVLAEEEYIKTLPSTLKQNQHFFKADDDVDHATWDAFFQEVSKLGRILYAGHVGSRCYNLHTPQSDIDMIVIVAFSTEEYFAIEVPKQTYKNQAGFKPDFTLHEIGLAIEMLLSGDARIVETLFSDPRAVVFESEEWAQLRSIRNQFLSKAVVRKYLSEVHGVKGLKKLDQLSAAAKTEEEITRLYKQYYILFRLLRCAELILTTSSLALWVDETSAERAEFMRIRSRKIPLEELSARLKETVTRIEAQLAANITLPETASSSAELEDIIWKLRKTELRSKVPLSVSSCTNFLLPIPEPYLSPLIPSGSRALLTCQFKGARICIYAQPTKLTILASLHQDQPKSQTHEEPTLVYELAKFSSLLMKGNPNLLELFIAIEEKSVLLSDLRYGGAWMELQATYQRYITEKVVSSILGGLKHKAKQQKRAASKDKAPLLPVSCASDSPLLLRKIEAAPAARLVAVVSAVPDATSLTDCVRNVRLALFLE